VIDVWSLIRLIKEHINLQMLLEKVLSLVIIIL